MSVQSNTLQQLMNLIGSKYLFNKENYPNMDDSRPETKLMFAINHSSLHMQKSLGKIAEVLEEYDHKGKKVLLGGIAQAQESTVKIFINALKLAEELNLSAEQLFERVEQFYKDR